MTDLKQEAARTAATLVVKQKQVGLGEGSTIGYMVNELKNRQPEPGRVYYSSSEKTKRMLEEAGFETGDLDKTSVIDIYFDGCDQMDHALNALKSGAGIHSMEKLVASMATEFVLIGDDSKYVPRFDGKFPLVVELIPEALAFVQSRIKIISPGVKIELRGDREKPLQTRHENLLIDCRIADWLRGSDVAAAIKQLPGVLDHSLFSGIARRAVIAGSEGARIVSPHRD